MSSYFKEHVHNLQIQCLGSLCLAAIQYSEENYIIIYIYISYLSLIPLYLILEHILWKLLIVP